MFLIFLWLNILKYGLKILNQMDFFIVGLLRAFNVLMYAVTLQENVQVYSIPKAYLNIEALFMVLCFKEHTFGNAGVKSSVQWFHQQ